MVCMWRKRKKLIPLALRVPNKMDGTLRLLFHKGTIDLDMSSGYKEMRSIGTVTWLQGQWRQRPQHLGTRVSCVRGGHGKGHYLNVALLVVWVNT